MSTQPLAAAAGDLSREDRERLVEQRMENMRLKNEELLRRHAEVEADKKNADLLSSAALKENALRKPPPPPVATTAVSEKRSSKPRVPRVRPVPPEDGPPPDPNYRFLADRMREGGDGGGEGAGGGSRRHRDNYGGQDFENVRHAMRQDKALQRESGGHALPPKLAMTGRQRREYEQWKSDRASIDQERMQRHMDAEGHFTREWDLHKEHQLGPPSPPSEHRGSSCQGSRIYLRGARGGHHGAAEGVENGSRGGRPRGGAPRRSDQQQQRQCTQLDEGPAEQLPVPPATEGPTVHDGPPEAQSGEEK